jgi:hypothetical protein
MKTALTIILMSLIFATVSVNARNMVGETDNKIKKY